MLILYKLIISLKKEGKKPVNKMEKKYDAVSTNLLEMDFSLHLYKVNQPSFIEPTVKNYLLLIYAA